MKQNIIKQKNNAKKITKDTTIGEIVEKYPQIVPALMDLGLHCVGCYGASFETVEMGLKVHGMDDKEVEEAVKKLNEVIEKSSKKK